MTLRNGEDGTALISPPKPPPVSVAASLRTLSIFAGAVALALVVHLIVSRNEPPLETRFYTIFLGSVLVIAVITAPAQISWPRLRQFRQNLHPILTAAALLLCLWEIITSGVRLLPLPYFPESGQSPAQSHQRSHAALRQHVAFVDPSALSGYAIGTCLALITV